MRHGVTALCVRQGTRFRSTCRTRMNQFCREISSDHKLVSGSLSALCAIAPPGESRDVPAAWSSVTWKFLALANHDLKSIRSLFSANSRGLYPCKNGDRQVAPCLLCRSSNDNVVVSLQPQSASMVRFPCGSQTVTLLAMISGLSC
ncbi:hypothetical protein KVT40_005512 [Elsinoe batatas]|uniref:Uncharacterized protein n=1 Tax=Elsinoe batatas TaxID=2601811 RepID=A0A8K0PFH2_9PEZI|nr:hypothetical protein KVT40_005512 [Elsinoe batatas]